MSYRSDSAVLMYSDMFEHLPSVKRQIKSMGILHFAQLDNGVHGLF
jgi:hypothetical protein